MTPRSSPLLVFLGPSLPAPEARRIARCTVLPPARQGDVWRALTLRPRAIALVDGVFGSEPSVWHHELLDALDGGVAVFGGASMGALRAAELSVHGMVGVGEIYAAFAAGRLTGDDEVALLHGPADAGHRPLTVPLVQVRFTAEAARAKGELSTAEARRLVAAAAAIHYADRTWRALLDAAAGRLGAGAMERLRALVRQGPPDPKADDARKTIAAAAAFAASGAPLTPSPSPRRPSSLVRRAKLRQGATTVGGALLSSGAVIDSIRARDDALALAASGQRTLLLAGLARSLGLQPSPVDVDAAGQSWLASLGVPPRRRASFLAASGLDDADARRLFEDLALEELALHRAERLVPDGPSAEEGLARAAQLDGSWAGAARALAAARVQDAPRRRQAMSKRRPPAPPPPPEPFHAPFKDLAGRLGVSSAPPAAPPPPEPPSAPARGPARAVVRLERKGRGGKTATVVDGLGLGARELERWLEELKRSLGCGGAVEDAALALQGDHRERVKGLLEAKGVRKVTLG